MGQTIHDFTDNFETATRENWVALVEAGLKGRDFEAALVRRTDDGIVRGPLNMAADIPNAAHTRTRLDDEHLAGRDWHIAAPVRDPDITYANGQALRDLQGGASALRLSLDPSGEAGTAVRTVNGFKRLFEGIHTVLIPISFAPGDNAGFAALLAANSDWHGLSVTLGLSPLSGAFLAGVTPELADTMKAANWASANAPKWRTVTINARAVHEAGGTEAQELAFIAAAGACYIRALMFAGLSAADAASQIAIEVAADQDGHLGIAKIRAARHIWARITESFGVPEDERTVPIHAVTSLRMMTRVDPWTNMLRIMAAGFGAVCGGADFVTTRPFTDALGLATPFGHRTARNMQLLMAEESHLGQVADPAAGSYFHEAMTQSLAETAWALFQDIERAGGIETEAAQDLLAGQMRKSHRQRLSLIAKQAKPVLGVSLYPATNARRAEIRRAPKFPKGSSAPLMSDGNFHKTLNEAKSGYALPVQSSAKAAVLPPVRISEPYEKLLATGPHSPVLLIALSDDPMTKARVDFVRSYLASASIEANVIRPQSILFPLQEALERLSAPLVFFAGSDADYEEIGPKIAKALNKARANKIWVCAKPAIAAQLPYAHDAIYNGQDRMATLSELLGLMGVVLDV